MTDNRARFGWAENLDNDPQYIWENKDEGDRFVAVIPLPFSSPKQKKRVRDFAKEIWSGIT